MRKTNGKPPKAALLRMAATLLVLALVLPASGCAKENKYVNVGVEMSTAGMSLYLTNTVNGFQRISNYVVFSPSSLRSPFSSRCARLRKNLSWIPFPP